MDNSAGSRAMDRFFFWGQSSHWLMNYGTCQWFQPFRTWKSLSTVDWLSFGSLPWLLSGLQYQTIQKSKFMHLIRPRNSFMFVWKSFLNTWGSEKTINLTFQEEVPVYEVEKPNDILITALLILQNLWLKNGAGGKLCLATINTRAAVKPMLEILSIEF